MSQAASAHYLMFPLAHGGEPVLRLVCLGRHLRAAGHSVAFACADPAARVARSAGFRVVALPDVTAEAWSAARSEGTLLLHDEPTIHEHVRLEIEAIRQERPQVVVGDGRLTLPVSAHVARVRYAQVARAGASAVRLEPPEVPASRRRTIAGVDVTERMPAPMRRAVVRRLLHAWAEPYNRSRRRLGMPAVESVLDVATGEMNLLADIPEVVPTRDIPETFHWAGPLVPGLNPDAPAPDWLATFSSERPTVLVALDRLGSLEFLTDAIKRFMHSACQAVFVTGELCRPEDVHDAPPNLRFIPWVPAEEALWRAATVLLFDGYTPLMYTALRYGVPMVGMPATPDTAENLRHLQAAGAGLLLSDGLARVVQACEHVATRMSFRDTAARLSTALAQDEYGAPAAARRLVEFAGVG